MGFKSSSFNHGDWIIKIPTGNRYDYICTHVDDFEIIADETYEYLLCISDVLFVKTNSPCEYYLGNN